MSSHLITLIFFSLLFNFIYAEYRNLDGTNNNLNTPLPKTLVRGNPPISFYSVINVTSSELIPTPGDYTSLVPIGFERCSSSSNLPKNLYPLPRCVSNLGSMRENVNDVYNLDALGKFKSQRKISHMTTFFGFFMVTDVIAGRTEGVNYPTGIYIPQDDQLYLSNYSSNPNLAFSTTALPFNRSDPTPDSAGVNSNTPFVDGSQIYGLTPERLSQIRDYEGNRGKMLLIKNNNTSDSALGYPPKDANGEYIFGHIAQRGRNLFTDMYYIIFLREHNRRCDYLWIIHGDAWTDEMYFQESKKWVIGLLQRVAFYEYLGIILGSPLPTYKGYNPNLDPRIDTFFATVTYRYGHSELSENYYIVNENGNTVATLPLNLIQVPLVETYGVPIVAISMALQWQDEVDIYFADTVRKFPLRYQNQDIDITSLDVVRSRDHAIPLYNDAREAMGLKRATGWSDITDDAEVQQRLIDTYGDINKVEAFIGGLAESHIVGGSFGELFHTSFYNQWMNIRDSDRFWYEANDSGYTQEEQDEINHTTLSQIIARNIPDSYKLPSNIWMVQPPVSLNDPNINNISDPSLSDYPLLNHVLLSDLYEVYWKIVDDQIYFKLMIASTNAWFAIGFNDKGSMITSDMIIFRNTNDNNIEARRYQAEGYYTPKLLDNQDLTFKVVRTDVKSGVYSLVEFSRPLSDGGGILKTIAKNKPITMIYAWNPSSKIISYHTANRGFMEMDFFSYKNVDNMRNARRKNLLAHGIAMTLVWAVFYPISIWRVRYKKTINSYVKRHRNFQILGAFFVAIFGGIALAVLEGNSINTVHGKIGVTIISMMSIQLGFGWFNMWSLGNVESVNLGIIRLLRYMHAIFGVMLIILSWVNINLGINEYSKQFNSYNWSIICFVWMGLLIFIFIISENLFRIRDMKFRYSSNSPTTRVCTPTQQLRYFIKDYDQLPILSLNEFNQRVVRGMKLVLVENMIFDIGKWIRYHPGGAKILQRVVGTDITHDFFGNNFSSQIKYRLDDEESYTSDQNEKEGENQVVFTKRSNSKNDGIGESLANLIDVININKTLGTKSSRVSVHKHSRYATEKLATMVIAKLPELSDVSDGDNKGTIVCDQPLFTSQQQQQQQQQQQHQHYTSQYNQLPLQIEPPDLSSPNIFRRCIITNIEIVTNNYQSDSPIVKKFTFKSIHEGDNFPYRRFFPGDYIEIMCDIDQQRVIRQYTPLSQELFEDYRKSASISSIEIGKMNKKTFWILVKIYKDGLMSKYLDKQLKNFEILVRGPFNLSDDEDSNNPRFSVSDCILLNSNKPNGCWNKLFMVCGGSGVTPMLQMIHYHLEQYQLQRRSGETSYLYLLFANNSYTDIVYKRHLDYLVKKFMGSFIITHILVNPPDNWNGLKGYIDDTILLNWLSNNINIDSDANTSTVPSQVGYYSQQQQFTADDYAPSTTSLIMPSEQQRIYSTQDLLIKSSSTTIDKLPDNSKIIVCGNDGFMLSIQSICRRIGIKEKDTLFLI